MTDADPYLDPATGVLRNLLGIVDAATLAWHEREIATLRIAQGCPSGDFDLAHLRAIHRHIFQDIYAWAGELRTVEISKGGHAFQLRQYIQTGMADVHARLRKADRLRGLDITEFAEQAAIILGDVNHVHPFREGNGRTQLQYMQQLAAHAGHQLDIRVLAGGDWIVASRAANEGDYTWMASELARALGSA